MVSNQVGMEKAAIEGLNLQSEKVKSEYGFPDQKLICYTKYLDMKFN